MTSFGKSPSGFRRHGTSLEPGHMNLGSERTPIDSFFVCSAGDAPSIDPGAWRLTIDGDATEGTILRLADLESLPQHRVSSWLECAGNGRTLYELVGGHPRSPRASDTPWLLGAMGMADWAGPRLGDVLALAGYQDAAFVGPEGSDLDNPEGHPVRMSIPMDKAFDPDTIVALEMNGEPLTAAHGAPARMLVPGWVGAYSVKWLHRIEVSTRWIPSWRADEYYVRRNPEGDKLGPATAHPVKSSLALPWPATLRPGPQEIRGYARAAGVAIEQVEYRVDDGAWQSARLVGPNERWTWSPFEFDWTATPGNHLIRTRATDARGQTQPRTIPYNPRTILWNAIIPHPVEITG